MKPGTILLVDDEESYLEVVADALAMAGYRCLRAHDGREALEVAREQRPTLIVTDYMMPRMTGVELLRALRADELLAKIPTVLLSAIRPASADLATRFLLKPIHVEAIETCIAELLEPSGSASTRAAPPPSHSNTREDALNWVAHEIKNPLGVAVLHTDLLLAHVSDDFGRKHLQGLKRQLGRMDELVTSVLDAARLDDGRVVLHRARIDLAAFVERVMEDWRVHPTHAFELRIAERPIECDLDPERARQILDNLISNAMKYGGADRRVVVEVSQTEREAQVRVKDFGQGIAPADLQRIFDRFHRAKHGGRGHGLGLYIAAALARLHDGAITVDSKLGVGSTFLLSLPRPRAATPDAA
jgi:two-component system, sensor histidine kinase and response regulator